MIRITRSHPAPAHLTSAGPAAMRKHAAALAKGKALSFDRSIYGDASVKSALVTMQHEKCAFCEAKVRHVAHGDVEHFRPKGGFKQTEADKLSQPGYWWRAYEWENLLFACQVCNGRHKGNLFPLADATKRRRKPTDDLNSESPIFINPADPKDADPETLIDWRGDTPFAKKGNRRGRETITGLGLDEPNRWGPRETFYVKLKHLWEAERLLAKSKKAAAIQKAAEIRVMFANAIRDNAEYAGMIRAAVKRGFA